MKLKSILFWLLSVLLMLSISVYQRMTGPTKPMRGSVLVNESEIKYKLIRTWGDDSDAKVIINVPDESVKGIYFYKRYKSFDSWDTLSMKRVGDELIATLPQLPPAGKVMYHIILMDETKETLLNKTPAVLRYKGHVPAVVLIPHIILMFLAMLFSMRTGFEALFIKRHTYRLTFFTIIFLFTGGLILGPIVQKYAFGAYWTGWPFGHDLTDNKTAIAFIFWMVALFVLYRRRQNRFWPVVASFMLLAVYLIPHSMLGSEIDFTEEVEKTEQTD